MLTLTRGCVFEGSCSASFLVTRQYHMADVEPWATSSLCSAVCSDQMFLLISCLACALLGGMTTSRMGRVVAVFAVLSASSLPHMLECPEIHVSVPLFWRPVAIRWMLVMSSTLSCGHGCCNASMYMLHAAMYRQEVHCIKGTLEDGVDEVLELLPSVRHKFCLG